MVVVVAGSTIEVLGMIALDFGMVDQKGSVAVVAGTLAVGTIVVALKMDYKG